MSVPLISLLIFLACTLVIELLIYAYRTIRNPHRRKIRRRLRTFSAIKYGKEGEEIPDIVKNMVLSDVPLLNRLLWHIPGTHRLNLYLRKANARYTVGFFLLLTAILALTGFLGSSLLTRNPFSPLIVAAVLGAIPFLYFRLKKRQRMKKFQRQLPEALELIARSLRAGHAFTSGMKMAADEFDDPLGTEFQATVDEINFGISVTAALKSLTSRVDCPDLDYFVVSVILQYETGGNLADIIESIAYLIRERFKFQGKLRALSAEARWSAYVLIALPFFLIIAFRLISPEYLTPLFSEPTGRIVASIAAFMMGIGIFVMKRMINIRV